MLDHGKFAAFILSNGRPNNVLTVDTLKKSGYTGKVYIIIDDEDPCGDEYRKAFGSENVIEFDKKAAAKTFDPADTSSDKTAIAYSRNASFGIAKSLGLDYFVQLDDDYASFRHRWPDHGQLASTAILNMDKVVELMLTFLDESGALTVAMSQGGDAIGGINLNVKKGILRKAMNSFFVRTDHPVGFLGRLNDDVNAYVVHGSRGKLFFTIMPLQLTQKQTQQSSGGMTETYLDSGTYVKSFYTVMMAPSCVKIGIIGPTNVRYHHSVNWNNAVPKIISERHRKTKTATRIGV